MTRQKLFHHAARILLHNHLGHQQQAEARQRRKGTGGGKSVGGWGAGLMNKEDVPGAREDSYSAISSSDPGWGGGEGGGGGGGGAAAAAGTSFVSAQRITGWCSWYAHGARVTALDIIEAAHQMRLLREAGIPLKYLQVGF